MTDQASAVLCGTENLERLRARFEDRRAQVYCTNGSRLTGTVHFMPGKWLEVTKDRDSRALVNLDYVVSIAILNSDED